MHHIAIGTANLEAMSDFYRKLPGLKFIKNHYYNSDEMKDGLQGKLRSVWFSSGQIILMLEDDTQIQAPKALVFSIAESGLTKSELKELPLNWTHNTDFTIYFKDPDGNTLGYTDY
jgi:catechol 2,3-dioxygenase-like lactoylglutathione lyase family enzyme